ncbi:fasciclin domain-containing protein [Micromonospora sp. C28SCA-DRY-2]|uniref:fasciclin domain-containing protein n=1 Tax=Micromonospora sp. C28SCA-DRY-2 TaxID=3059522 RepID=UPI002674F912|nr:fasciclin domain-containing protein [Micromonospora sp. C28SCA-DRY-2]MDO3705683.1 fasciclin domain-containing protein [Micromonospora sp. C28SCA-DRY-2]
MPHPRTAPALAAAALLLAATACTADDSARPAPAPATAVAVTGPLCAALPTGSEPGNPTFLAGQPAEAALTWMPTLTTFEAALRTSGALTGLDTTGGITILAPTDDAFAAKFSDDTWDTLMTRDHQKLRTLVTAHLIAGAHTVDELAAAGTTRTLDGTTLTVTRTGPTTRFGGKADAVCADYQAARARIHIVDTVLGPLPTTADGTGHRAH